MDAERTGMARPTCKEGGEEELRGIRRPTGEEVALSA